MSTNTGKVTILEEASRIVDGDREKTYGHPSKNFAATARLWATILGHEVTLKEVALMMVALKLARELHRPGRDNLVDMCGYLRCIEKMTDAGTDVEKMVPAGVPPSVFPEKQNAPAKVSLEESLEILDEHAQRRMGLR